MLALVSNHYADKVMAEANLGVAVLVPKKKSPEWAEKLRLRACADTVFYIGTVLTAIGIILQILGTVTSDKNEERGSGL